MGDWVLDSLVGFLQSPRWTHPLNNFVDENCVVFDPGEENKFSYTDIHKQYSSLVESLLEQFMGDIGMSSQQFIKAWEKCGANCSFEKSLTQQIVAAEDFLSFKALMVQRNIDLEKEAWKMVEEKRRVTNFQEPPPSYSTVLYSDDESSLHQALELSKKEYEMRHLAEEEELRRLIAMAEEQWTTGSHHTPVLTDNLTKPVQNMAAFPTHTATPTAPAFPTYTATPTAPAFPTYTAAPTAPAFPTHTATPPTIPNTMASPIVYDIPVPNMEPSGAEVCPTVSKEATSIEHTEKPLTATTKSTADLVSQSQREGITSEISQTPIPTQPIDLSSLVVPPTQPIDLSSLVVPPTQPIDLSSLVVPPAQNLTGAEAAAQWIQSARQELSSSPDHTTSSLDHTSLCEASPKSQESRMRQQRDHLLQMNKEQRERELKAFIANPPPSVTVVRPSPTQFTWFKRGKQDEKKMGKTGVLCTAIASKLKRSS